ncbi:uncharacterized protein Nmlp_3411 [Natronomonas moolapensis 8.8.11]|uniref:Uncharacterized protein n=2 Tax=Natronomonas moolapensis TaxID=416273 RepID=M1Y4T4_NATM8|nr:uncharacterized protein Nmlp_3411 [Natronomonas moolapensis 8.8.11]
MNRRNVLVGLGAAATGSSVVLGSGAFAQVSTARSVTIAVDKDSEALVQLEAGDPTPVQENGSGELEISTENFGGAFNENATVEIGDPDNPGTTPAFSVTNNFDVDIDLTLNLQDIDSSNDFTLYFDQTSSFPDTLDANGSTDSTLGSDTDTTLNIAIKIDTQSAGSNFDGTIQIDASHPSSGGA